MPVETANSPRKRNPDQTRERILAAAYEEIYHHGFRSASLETILTTAGITKGALYHHFSSKTELGYAVVDEVIRPVLDQMWGEPLRSTEDPIAALNQVRGQMLGAIQPLLYGCPLNNLALEMSPIDEGFRERVAAAFEHWTSLIEDALRRGQEKGHIRGDVDPRQTAAFFLATLEGAVSLAKNARSDALLNQCLDGLAQYMAGLKPEAG
jgi:AcrR family transcriptional regulator